MTNAEPLQLWLESVGYDVNRYSGRGMYGKECLSVNVNSINDLLRLGILMGANGFADEEFYHVKTDSMGHGAVAYWPDIPWLYEEPEGLDEEDGA